MERRRRARSVKVMSPSALAPSVAVVDGVLSVTARGFLETARALLQRGAPAACARDGHHVLLLLPRPVPVKAGLFAGELMVLGAGAAGGGGGGELCADVGFGRIAVSNPWTDRVNCARLPCARDER